MPYTYSTFSLPCGTRAVRADATGVITRADAEGMVKRTTPGGEYFGIPLLIDNRQTERMDAEARSLFGLDYDPNIEHPWVAIVVSDAVFRVTVSFLLRTAKTTTVSVFPSEPEAIAWLDEKCRQDAARSQR